MRVQNQIIEVIKWPIIGIRVGNCEPV